MVSACNYPPEEIIKPIFGKPNYEFIILWILNNNDVCTWGNLKEKITHSTLSTYLSRLKDKEYIEKSEYNQYKITAKGKDRYYELSEAKQQKRKLSYPPEVILRRRNYDHWILWMLSNNNFCKWSDFTEPPLSINQSSLSKKLNSLLDRDPPSIRKDDKLYRVTRLGKSEYSNMLRLYDLDRQSLLEEESKRIREITDSTNDFFKKYNIKDAGIKFRFLNNKLKLPYEKLQSALDSEHDYNKILLFLSTNHPDRYPNYISPEDFSEQYNLKLIKLNFIVLRIVDENVFSIKFFKLDLIDGKTYYIQVNGKLERILNVIVEDHITRFTYLNNLRESTPLNMEIIVSEILEEILDNLFDPGLKSALRVFLPEYINYLAYKIEQERRAIDSFDKLEGLIWKEILNFTKQTDLNMYINPTKSFEEALEEINRNIEDNPSDLNLYYVKSKILIHFDKYNDALILLDEIIQEFPENIKDLFLIEEIKALIEDF